MSSIEDPGPDFAKGASGPLTMYDTSPSGLGMNPTYLAQNSASATSTATFTAVKDILNNGTVVDAAVRSKLNFIAGTAVTLTLADNSASDRVDVTIASTAAIAQLFDSTLVGSVANFDMTSISQAFNHLRLVGFFHGDTGSAVTVRFNNDSGTNYDWHGFRVDNGTVTGDVATGATAMQLGSYPDTTDGDTATDFSTFEMIIPNYRDATNHKSCIAASAARTTSGPSRRLLHRAGYWFGASAAITRVTVLASTNFIAGSRITLYGEL